MLFKNSYSSKELKGTPPKNKAVLNLNNIVCIVMWHLVTYSNCFKICSFYCGLSSLTNRAQLRYVYV